MNRSKLFLVFTIFASFASCAGWLIAFRQGIPYLVMLVPLVLLSFCAGWSAWRSTQLEHFRAIAEKLLEQILSDLGADSVDALVREASRPHMREAVASLVGEAVAHIDDPTQRAWAYVSLGRIGGRTARKTIKKALKNEQHDLARLALNRAQEELSVKRPARFRRWCSRMLGRR